MVWSRIRFGTCKTEVSTRTGMNKTNVSPVREADWPIEISDDHSAPADRTSHLARANERLRDSNSEFKVFSLITEGLYH